MKVFTNAKKYNLPDSELHEAAHKLAEEFEHLLCNWVYNVQDASVFDVAKGPWDAWTYLKYFDSEDPKEDFCRETGTRTREDTLHACSSCEDQYLRTLTEPAPRGRYQREGDEESWICTRCDAAQQLPVVVGPSGYAKELVNPSFNKGSPQSQTPCPLCLQRCLIPQIRRPHVYFTEHSFHSTLTFMHPFT